MALPLSVAGGSGPHSNNRPLLFLVVAVFFLFGGITNLNDVLIPKLKGLYSLNYTQAMLVQFAFFTSYAIFSIPAGLVMKKLGYFRGIVLGFAIMAGSCLLFRFVPGRAVHAGGRHHAASGGSQSSYPLTRSARDGA
jgi:MFS transporter, FHS family, L-fucose permease